MTKVDGLALLTPPIMRLLRRRLGVGRASRGLRPGRPSRHEVAARTAARVAFPTQSHSTFASSCACGWVRGCRSASSCWKGRRWRRRKGRLRRHPPRVAPTPVRLFVAAPASSAPFLLLDASGTPLAWRAALPGPPASLRARCAAAEAGVRESRASTGRRTGGQSRGGESRVRWGKSKGVKVSSSAGWGHWLFPQ